MPAFIIVIAMMRYRLALIVVSRLATITGTYRNDID